jgi:cell shape-determining protein MreC
MGAHWQVIRKANIIKLEKSVIHIIIKNFSETLRAVVSLLEDYDKKEKTAEKTTTELNEEVKLQNLMKNDILQKLQKSQGDLTKIKEALASNFTKAQIARITSNQKTRWSDDDYSNAIVLLGLSPKGYRSI